METEHTPIPWQTEVLGHTMRIVTNDEDAESSDVAMLWDCRVEKNQANAAFIVRACNAFDPMIEALNEALIQLRAYAEEAAKQRGREYCEEHNDSIMLVLSALAKAEAT